MGTYLSWGIRHGAAIGVLPSTSGRALLAVLTVAAACSLTASPVSADAAPGLADAATEAPDRRPAETPDHATASPAEPSPADPTATDPGPADPALTTPLVIEESPLDFLEQRINTGEAEVAQRELETMIAQVEQVHHRYHADLIEPVKLLGDAHLRQGRPDQAIDQYARARHIARVSHGLFDRRQLAAVYSEADALKALGDLETAAKREEYAYEVARRDYEEYDAGLIEPLTRLADFYLFVHNPISARTLYNRAFLIHEHNKTTATDAAVDVLKKVAISHRHERFPELYIRNATDDRLNSPPAGLINSDLDFQYRSINTFPAGEKALQRVVEIQQERFSENAPEALEAMIELADWHLMFGRNHAANTLYRHVFQQMVENEQDPIAFFKDPVLIYYPRPENPRKPPIDKRGDPATGQISLAFTVASTGRVRSLETTEIEGPDEMEFRVRRSMRVAVFRPRVQDGKVVSAPEQRFRYDFPYVKTRKASAASETPRSDSNDAATPTAAEEDA